MTEYLDLWSKPGARKVGKQSLSQRIEQAFQPAPQGLISGLDQTKMAVAVDVSHWTGALTRAVVEGADIWLPKLSDGHQIKAGAWNDLGNYKDDQVDNTIQVCYEASRPVIPFHYAQWDYTADQWAIDKIITWQYDIICYALARKTPKVSYHGLALDFEEKGCTDTNYKKIAEGLYNKLKASDRLEADMPLLIYSSEDMLNTYPAFRYWLESPGTNRQYWPAQWVWTKVFRGNWAAFRSQVLPNVNMRVVTPLVFQLVQWGVNIFIDNFNLDLNMWNRTKDSLYSWLGYKGSVTPPEPPVEPPVEPGDNPDLTAITARVAELERWRKS